MSEQKNMQNNEIIEAMFKAGAHFGYSKSRRHPSVAPYIFGVKNKTEIIDLEKTKEFLDKAMAFVSGIAKDGKKILFIGGKSEAKNAIKNGASIIDMPYVSGRWIGGTLTNTAEIKKRIARYEDLTSQKEKGELSKYTKKERLLIDRLIVNLEEMFGGIIGMKDVPKAVFVIDPKKEIIAVTEAKKTGIPVIALLNTDCNMKNVDYPIVANDSSVSSISFFVDSIVNAYKAGKTPIVNK